MSDAEMLDELMGKAREVDAILTALGDRSLLATALILRRAVRKVEQQRAKRADLATLH